MNKFYKEDSFIKNIYITETGIMGSDEDYENLDAFLEKINAKKKAMLDTFINFEFAKIQKIILFPEENGVQLFFDDGKGIERTYLQFGQQADYDEVLKYILSKRTDLKLSKEQTSSKTVLIKPILYTIAGAGISFALIATAKGLEQGENIRATGSKRGLKRLMIMIAETLGFTGSLVVGIIIVAGLIYYTYTTYAKSKVDRDIYS